MRTLILLLGSLLTVAGSTQAQNAVAQKVQSMQAQFDQTSIIAPLVRISDDGSRTMNISHIVTDVQFARTSPEVLNNIRSSNIDVLSVDLPLTSEKSIELQLYRTEVFAPDFNAYTSSNSKIPFDVDQGVHYRGVVKGVPASIVAFSFFEETVMGMVAFKSGKYVIGKLATEDDILVIYKDQDLKVASTFDCEVDDDAIHTGKSEANGPLRDQGDCVRVYVELDNDLVEQRGGAVSTVNFIIGLYNQVFTIYENEGIPMQLSEVFAWDATSPYTGTSSGDLLDEFQVNSPDFNGNLGCFHSIKSSAGLAGSIGGLCSSNVDYRMCYSGISLFYEQVPTFSSAVFVATHEIGHILGSWHTHACQWNGDNTALDACPGFTAGGCPIPDPAVPEEGGTIMSYCASVVGINFSLGFGPQPGEAIREVVYGQGNCLEPCEAPSNNDAGIVDILIPLHNVCGTSYTPEVTLKNFGTNPLTSVDIIIDVNGEDVLSSNWNVNLLPGYAVDITLTPVQVDEGYNSLAIRTQNPNGQVDADQSNDRRSSDLGAGSSLLQSTIVFDASPPRFTWALWDNSGNPLAFGGPYNHVSPYTTIVENICIPPDGCYNFVFYSTFGALCCQWGNGSYELVHIDSGVTIASGAEEGTLGSTKFCLPIQPCGAAGSFTSTTLDAQNGTTGMTSASFPANSNRPIFSISGLDQKTNGNPSLRYIDVVHVDYMNAQGETVAQGTYSGDQQSSADVDIFDIVQSITITLENGYAGSNSDVSISLSDLTFCGEGGCSDSDIDAVCDEDDICPGGNDNEDTDNDGIPDYCDPCVDSDNDNVCDDVDICLGGDDNPDADGDGVPDYCDVCPDSDDTEDSDGDGIPDACDNGCIEVNTTFDPLSHLGSGQSSVLLNYGSPQTNISFSISGINQKLNGNPGTRYIEEVRVLVDGIMQFTFSGSTSNGTEDILIVGPANDIEVVLFDSYDGVLEQGNMSVALSDAVSCAEAAMAPEWTQASSFSDDEITASIYPNPTSSKLIVEFSKAPESADVIVRDILGRTVMTKSVEQQRVINLALSGLSQVCFISTRIASNDYQHYKVLIID